MIEAVNPAALEPLPLVYTLIGAALYTNFKNYDLAVDGSPSNKMFISPLKRIPSGSVFVDPLNSWHATALFMSSLP